MVVSLKLKFSNKLYYFTIGNIYSFRLNDGFSGLGSNCYELSFIGTSRADGGYLFNIISAGNLALTNYNMIVSSYESISIISSKEILTDLDGSLIVEEAVKNYEYNSSKIISFIMSYMNISSDDMYLLDAHKGIIRDIKLKIITKNV